jgi:anti-anti-sigma factor
MSHPPDLTPVQLAQALPAFIGCLPQPTALVASDGTITTVNAAWRDMFFQDCVGLSLEAACQALFVWEPSVWEGVAADIATIQQEQIGHCQFEAQLQEPPERWVTASLSPNTFDGGLIWHLTDVTRWQLSESEALSQWRQVRDGIDSISDGFALYDAQDRLVFCNRRYREIYATSADLFVPGRTFREILLIGARRGQYVEAIGREEEWVDERVRQHQALESLEQQLGNGRWLRIAEQRTSDGGIVGVRSDITAAKQAEELRRQRSIQAETLRAQEALLSELSTPILQISADTLVLPLIGTIDSNRAMRIVDTALDAVASTRAKHVLLDVTGVPIVDTQTAATLLRCARAVALLGAEMVLTGIRPDVAQTIIALGIEFGDLVTRADLQAGIRYALNRKQRSTIS